MQLKSEDNHNSNYIPDQCISNLTNYHVWLSLDICYDILTNFQNFVIEMSSLKGVLHP